MQRPRSLQPERGPGAGGDPGPGGSRPPEMRGRQAGPPAREEQTPSQSRAGGGAQARAPRLPSDSEPAPGPGGRYSTPGTATVTVAGLEVAGRSAIPPPASGSGSRKSREGTGQLARGGALSSRGLQATEVISIHGQAHHAIACSPDDAGSARFGRWFRRGSSESSCWEARGCSATRMGSAARERNWKVECPSRTRGGGHFVRVREVRSLAGVWTEPAKKNS
jgi:hypothetical protein